MTTHENILSEVFQEYENENEFNSEALELESIMDRLKALYQKVPDTVKGTINKGISIGNTIGKLLSPTRVTQSPMLMLIAKDYAERKQVEHRRLKDRIENNPRSKQNIGSKEFEGTILGEILGISSHENELFEYESLMTEMQEFYENNFQNTNRNSILAEIMLEEEVGTNRSQMRNSAAKKINDTPNHPLKFLLKDGKFKSPRLSDTQLQKDLTIVEMGHVISNASSGNRKPEFMIQSAYLNQKNKFIPRFKYIDIDGVATDCESAKEWLKAGRFKDKKTIDKINRTKC